MHSVLIENTGERFDCAVGRSLLKGMEQLCRKGIPVGCRNGGCGICRVQIVEGRFQAQKMSRSQVSEADELEGVVLACRVTPLSDIRLRTLGLEPRAFAPPGRVAAAPRGG